MPEASTGVWSITTPELGETDEYVAFSHSITYTDTVLGSLRVALVPQETNPSTIYISGNNITGYYSGSFNISVLYKNIKNKFITVSNFRDIKTEELKEVIKYTPSLEQNKIYNYVATAYDATDLEVATTSFTKTVNNNWDLNRNLLIQYVNSTVVQDITLIIAWINSINSKAVTWRNASNIVIDWAHAPTEV